MHFYLLPFIFAWALAGKSETKSGPGAIAIFPADLSSSKLPPRFLSITLSKPTKSIQDDVPLPCNATLDNSTGYSCTISVRGRSSQAYPKKGFALSLKLASNSDDSKVDLVLQGPYADASLIRNALAMYLASSAGFPATPRFTFVELSVQGESGVPAYRGVYTLLDKIGKSLFPSPPFFLLQAAHAFTESYWDQRLNKTKETPLLQIRTQNFELEFAQKNSSASASDSSALASSFIRAVDNASRAATTVAPARISGSQSLPPPRPMSQLPSLLNGTSFVEYFLHTELTANPDSYLSSVFMYAFSGRPDNATGDTNANLTLSMGPVWDYDLAFGAMRGLDDPTKAGWRAKDSYVTQQSVVAGWYNALFSSDPGAWVQASKRWRELRSGPWSDRALTAWIQAAQAALSESGAAARNFARWPVSDLKPPKDNMAFTADAKRGFDGEVQFLLDFVLGRAAWMDHQSPVVASARL